MMTDLYEDQPFNHGLKEFGERLAKARHDIMKSNLPTPADVLAKSRAKAKREQLESSMLLALRAHRLDKGVVQQHAFHPSRKYRFDFAWPAMKVALEVDGGTFSGGRHTRGAGYAADCEKLNEATILGWRVLRVTGAHIKNGLACSWVRNLIWRPEE